MSGSSAAGRNRAVQRSFGKHARLVSPIVRTKRGAWDISQGPRNPLRLHFGVSQRARSYRKYSRQRGRTNCWRHQVSLENLLFRKVRTKKAVGYKADQFGGSSAGSSPGASLALPGSSKMCASTCLICLFRRYGRPYVGFTSSRASSTGMSTMTSCPQGILVTRQPGNPATFAA